MKFHGMVACLGGGDRFVMMFVFALSEGGTAAGERESQREENDSNCSEFHFFTLSEICFLRMPSGTSPFYCSIRNGHASAGGKALKHK
jgi:hypothetical protein